MTPYTWITFAYLACAALLVAALATAMGAWSDSPERRAESLAKARGLHGCVLVGMGDAHRIFACGTMCQRQVSSYTFRCSNGGLTLDYP